MRNVVAFDFGGSSGRTIFAKFDGKKIELNEVYRFENEPVTINDSFYWDTPLLFNELKKGLIAANAFGEYESIGIDTWGVDFGVLSKRGKLIENSYHYRDKRTVDTVEEVCKIVPRGELYKRTGNQIMAMNTLFQLYAMKKEEPEIFAQVDKILMTPDLFNYFLTGEILCECSMASTTQMMNPFTKEWDTELLEKLGLPAHILPPIVKSGTVIGTLTDSVCRELNMGTKQVVSVAAHDTASAVVAVPTERKDFAFLSCGTWSLFGTELNSPIVNEKSAKSNLTNETGYGDTTQFLNNIIGLWLIQETRRQFIRNGKNYSYADMERMAKQCEPFKCLIDPDAPEFVPQGDIITRIVTFCERTGQRIPKTDGEIVRCIYESLALKYKYTLCKLEECTGMHYEELHIVGGGTKDGFLCQLTADAISRRVIAGPIEATAIGNVVVQLMASGDIKSVEEARRIVANSSDVTIYEKSDLLKNQWEMAFSFFMKNILLF